MNERIKELAIEANMIASEPNGFDPTGLTKSQQKFAELIVRECISVVDDAERGGGNEIWDNAVKFIRKDIKQHFGVEE